MIQEIVNNVHQVAFKTLHFVKNAPLNHIGIILIKIVQVINVFHN
jgi:hypothetical protein